MSHKLLIVNGPGLGDLSDYGTSAGASPTLHGLQAACLETCAGVGLELDFRQTDDQEKMFRWIAIDSENFDGIIINPVGYSQAATMTFELYRAATRTIAHLKKPVIEVHITNIFRQSTEVTRPLHEPEGDMGFICGFGMAGYRLAIRAIARRLGLETAA